ncbi:ABC transporter ATP-binding protein [Porphyromonas endodontalis]|uniref:ABC transporter ATP-binding protein n=1 Tax=Porphyromonas endodontalis TaxID=28124 RepID=UPI0028E38BBE|nr:ABC transporter ATP-binding protein [Porphyromonas endodontalis]
MIKIEHLTFQYKKGNSVFGDLSLNLPKGSIVGLLGCNGEGKTTLLKLLCGQLLRQSGNLLVNGDDPSKRKRKALEQVYYLPEEIFMPDLKVKTYFSLITPFYPNYSQEIAEAAMKEFNLDWGQRLRMLSQGQKKKAAIALALSLQTPLLLMDEPTNSLDAPSKSVFRKLIAKYISEQQTVIISTHQLRDLETLIDSVVILEGGRILVNASTYRLSEIFSFGLVTNNNKAEALYEEPSISGEVGIFEHRDDMEEGLFSMELFLKGISREKEKISAILQANNLV